MITQLFSIVGVSERNQNSNSTLKIAMTNQPSPSPYVQFRIFKRANPNPICELHLAIHPPKKAPCSQESPPKRNYLPVTWQYSMSTIDDELILLEEFGAFSLDGNEIQFIQSNCTLWKLLSKSNRVITWIWTSHTLVQTQLRTCVHSCVRWKTNQLQRKSIHCICITQRLGR